MQRAGNSRRLPTQTTSIFDQHDPKKPSASRSNVLSSLRITQIVSAKPFLPIELISVVLDYCPPPTLIRFARVSRKLKELVYDDSRWIKRLQLIGVWDEEAARRRQEEVLRKRYEAQATRSGLDRQQRGPQATAGHASATGGGLLFDIDDEERGRNASARAAPQRSSLTDGFTDLVLSAGDQGNHAHRDYVGAATVLQQAQSIRGQARQQYGRIHGLLQPLYVDATDASRSADPLVFHVAKEARQQAQIVSNLVRFSAADGGSAWQDRVSRLTELVDLFENRILNELRAGYTASDTARMRGAVDIAVILGRGAAAVDAFVDTHPLIRGGMILANPLESVQGVTFGHIDLGPSQRYFERLTSVLDDQIRTSDQVFPRNLGAMSCFLREVCSKSTRPFVDTVLQAARDKDDGAILIAVPGVFEHAIRLSLSVQPLDTSPSGLAQGIQSELIKCFDGYIDRYLEDELERFKTTADDEISVWDKNLSEQDSRTESFLMSNVNRQAAKRDFLSSFKKVVMMPVNAVAAFPLPGTSKTSPEAGAPTEMPRAGVGIDGVGAAPATELAAKAAIMNSRLEGIKSLFSIELALSLVHHAKSAIERMAIIARYGGLQNSKAAALQCENVFTVLLDTLGQRHIRRGFDTAVSHLSSYDPRQLRQEDSESKDNGVAPLMTFLELVNVGDLIQQMLDVFYVQELIAPKLTDRDDFLNPATKQKKAFEQMLDERVAAGMSKGIDVLIDEVEYLCATTQLATDFNPSGADGKDSGLMDIGPTATAQRIVQLMQTHTELLVGSTEKTMLDVFFQEVGLRLFGALCKHIKRQRISVDGAIKLISDINLYASFVSTLKQKPLVPYFAALRELSQIYLVECGTTAAPATTRPSSSASMPGMLSAKSKSSSSSSSSAAATRNARAKELALIIADNDRYKGVFGADEVLEFAERRADWYSVKADVERAMYGIGCVVM